MGNTTTDDNFQAEKHYWQNFFLTKELDETVLNNFIYDASPFYNYLGLIDVNNHLAEDNLKSEKHLENIEVVQALLERLGWSSARDEDHIVKDGARTSFVESVVDDPIFKRQKRLHLSLRHIVRRRQSYPFKFVESCASVGKDTKKKNINDREIVELVW